MLVFLGGVAKIYPNLSDGVKKRQQAFLAPLPGMDLKTPYLVIAFRNANKHSGAVAGEGIG